MALEAAVRVRRVERLGVQEGLVERGLVSAQL